MKNKHPFSRRDFVKTGVFSAVAATGAGALNSCATNVYEKRNEPFRVFQNKNWSPPNGPAGMLFSQVGYEPGYPVKIIIRLPKKEFFPMDPTCRLIPMESGNEYETKCVYWGEVWKSHWWVAEFNEINEKGEWAVEILANEGVVFRDNGLKVKKDILWDSTIEWSSVDMLERRRHFTKVGAGWQDAGTLWVESPAQSAMIIAMTEMLERSSDRFDEKFKERIYAQLQVGCDYLVMTQKKAKEMGFPKGSFTHDLHGHETDILPNDAMKAVVALLKTCQFLPEKFTEKKQIYLETAKLAFNWLRIFAKPMGEYGYVKMQRGLSEDVKIPDNEWLTRDLLNMCWASVELLKMGEESAKEYAIEYARRVMNRQIPKEKEQDGFYGHFYEFESMDHAETSWCHGIKPTPKGYEFGADLGGVYPNYLMPVIDLLKLFPEHEDAENWKKTLSNFVYGYLIPGCEKNPFLIVPQGIFKGEGPIWFCGTFHGTNSIYGYTAALALELAELLSEPKLNDIAYGNLQWLAGLNAGITKENVKQGCIIFSMDIPDGAALPASMICHIGDRWAGTWFQTRGVICNGFSTGEQFVYDVAPKKENDGPFSLTDEDWIPHSAGWLTGLIRM